MEDKLEAVTQRLAQRGEKHALDATEPNYLKHLEAEAKRVKKGGSRGG